MKTQPAPSRTRRYSTVAIFNACSCLILLITRLSADTISADADIDKHALAATADDEVSSDKLATYLAGRCKNDRDKARAIYRWITDRIAYNAEGFLSGDYGDNKPAAVLKNRKAVCEGYSALYIDLSKHMGLGTARVQGHAKGLAYVAGQPLGNREKHAWLAVRIAEQWHLVDATWGAGYIDSKMFVKRFSNFYFLPAPDQLVFTHLPTDPKWQLMKTPLSAEEFLRRPKVGRHLFELGVSSETVLATMAEKDFRDLVHVYTHPSSATTLVKAPLKKHLVAGTEYEFTLKSDYVEMAVFNNKIFTPMKRDGDVFTVKFQPKQGTFTVNGRKNKDGILARVLAYVVD